MKKPNPGRPNFPGKNPIKKIYDERGVSPVIAVILMVAITVVLAAVLYVMVINMIGDPGDVQYGTLRFSEDSDTQGKYVGEYEGSLDLDSTEIKVFDKSHDVTIILRPSEETSKEIPDGLSITYYNVNADDKLNAADTLIIYGGEKGDKITIVDGDAGTSVASHELK